MTGSPTSKLFMQFINITSRAKTARQSKSQRNEEERRKTRTLRLRLPRSRGPKQRRKRPVIQKRTQLPLPRSRDPKERRNRPVMAKRTQLQLQERLILEPRRLQRSACPALHLYHSLTFSGALLIPLLGRERSGAGS